MQTFSGLNDKLVGTAETKVPSVFLLVNVATRRAEQVMEGASPALSGWSRGPIETALRELAMDQLVPDEDLKVWNLVSED